MLALIQIGKVSRRRHGTYERPEESRRQATAYYTVPDGQGQHIQVCRKTFSEIFALTHSRVQVLGEKKKIGRNTVSDQRGKSTKKRKYFPEIRDHIKQHIDSFPVEENHYSRSKSSKKFLSPDLNVNRMYRAYLKKTPHFDVTYKFYAEVFNNDFANLRFGRPKTDTCGTCDLHHNKIKASASNNEEKGKLKNALELHHRRAERARKTMDKDMADSQKIDSVTNVVSIDLEQVLFIPTLTHSAMFYSRQLSCYNLGVHLSDVECAYMCLWEESLTGRGGNEVSSCLLKALLQEDFPKKKKLIIWSDNCIGQNKNKIMLLLLIYLVAMGVYEQVEQKFLVSGHSYLPCDRDFAQIEKRKRVTKAFTPDNIKDMIKNACHKNPFKAFTMHSEDFKDIQKLADEMLNTTKLKISQVSWIMVNKENPKMVKIRKSFSELEAWTECNVFKQGKRIQDILGNLPLLECKNRISAEKIKNFEDMLDYIPLKYLSYWETLIDDTKKSK